jgi:hypothetical protein
VAIRTEIISKNRDDRMSTFEEELRFKYYDAFMSLGGLLAVTSQRRSPDDESAGRHIPLSVANPRQVAVIK